MGGGGVGRVLIMNVVPPFSFERVIIYKYDKTPRFV